MKLVSANNLPNAYKVNTYKVSMSCPNCLCQQEEEVVRGVLISEWNYVCKNCACTVEQYMEHLRKHQIKQLNKG